MNGVVMLKLTAIAVACCCAGMAAAQGADGGRAITSTRLGAAAASPAWTPARIEVFATAGMPIANSEGVTVHRVDTHEQLVAELNAVALPPDHQQALAIVRQRIQSMGPAFQDRVQAGLRSLQAVTVYGVERVPAVVFDGSRVVYDVTDVAKAIEIVRRGGGQPIGQRFIPGASLDSPPASPSGSSGRTP